MRGLSTDKAGRRKYQFQSLVRRETLSLGRMPLETAEEICGHVRRIMAARHAGATIDWLFQR